MHKVILLVLMLTISPVSFAYDFKESHYQKIDCDLYDGVTEYRNRDRTRTDCLTKEYSMEYDFVRKWYECITQSLHYARLNGNSAMCVVILESENDRLYLPRIFGLIKEHGLPITVRTVGASARGGETYSLSVSKE